MHATYHGSSSVLASGVKEQFLGLSNERQPIQVVALDDVKKCIRDLVVYPLAIDVPDFFLGRSPRLRFDFHLPFIRTVWFHLLGGILLGPSSRLSWVVEVLEVLLLVLFVGCATVEVFKLGKVLLLLKDLLEAWWVVAWTKPSTGVAILHLVLLDPFLALLGYA